MSEFDFEIDDVDLLENFLRCLLVELPHMEPTSSDFDRLGITFCVPGLCRRDNQQTPAPIVLHSEDIAVGIDEYLMYVNLVCKVLLRTKDFRKRLPWWLVIVSGILKK